MLDKTIGGAFFIWLNLKFTSEEKLQSVLQYLNGAVSSYDIAKSLETTHSTILKWVKQYEYIGVEAFVKSYTNYSAPFKLDALNFMIEKGTSLNETAAIFGIAAPSTIFQWRRQFVTKGFDALQSKKKGVHP